MSNSLYAFAPANGTTSYVNNGRNEVTSAGGASITYDANRNIASDGTWTYGYDAFSRLTNAGGMVITYDPAGQIYGLGSNSLTHIDGGPGALYTSAGAVSRRFVPGATQDETAAYYMGPAVTDRRYIIADNLNSSMGVTTASGGVSGPNTYDEYGNPGANNTGYVQFTGQFALSGDLPLYSYKNRVYHQALGRFLQTDPIGYGDGANLYAYVGNDPLNWIDPAGLAAQVASDCVTSWWTSDGAPTDFHYSSSCAISGGGGWGNGWQSCGRACYEELTGGGGGSIYDRFPGGGGAGRPSIQSDPQYEAFQAAYQQASRDNWWLSIPALAPAVAVPAAHYGSASLLAWLGNQAALRTPFATNSLTHIFVDKTGHWAVQSAARQRALQMTVQTRYFVGRNAWGASYYARNTPAGQIWVRTGAGAIKSGGINNPGVSPWLVR